MRPDLTQVIFKVKYKYFYLVYIMRVSKLKKLISFIIFLLCYKNKVTIATLLR